MKNICLVLSVFLFTACSSEPPAEIVGKKFESMDDCLSSIRNETGEILDPMTDKPNQVTGFLGKTGLQFNCELKETGTERTYIDGWFQRKAK